MANRNAWHTMDTEQICTRLDADVAKGLSRKQAAARAKKLNIRQPESLHPLFLPYEQPLYKELFRLLLDPILLLTLFVAVLAFFFKEYALGGAIVLILLINTICCAIANVKARSVWNDLQLYSNPMIKVIRSSKLYTTDARNVLPGDVVILAEGDICPADIRLVQGNRVCVAQYVPSNQGFTCVSVQKCGDILYSPDQDVFHPDCENIVYAGSVIEKGIARGIAVETGRHTYIGAANGTVPGTEYPKETTSISFIKRYFLHFSAIQAAMILPLTFLMAATMRYSLSFAECFLTSLALCSTAIVEHILSLVRVVRATGLYAAASEQENSAEAIIKNSDASDKLCQMTDLLLLDSAAISDGKYHLESVYACGNIYNTQELQNADVLHLVSDLYLYRTAPRSPEASHRDAFDAGLTTPIDALIKHVLLDPAAIDMTKISSYVSENDGNFTVHNRLNNGEYDIILSQNEQLLAQCTHVASHDQYKEMDDREHIAVRTLCRIYRESGYRILLVANRKQNRVTLIGVLAFAHRLGYHFQECCEQLLGNGVRVSAFLPNTPENIKILTESGLVRNIDTDVLTAQSAQDQGLDLPVAYGSYRAYLGFSENQMTDLIEKLKQRGNSVAAYSVDNRAQALMDLADLSITCDFIEYRSPKITESYYDKMPVDGKPFSARASQIMRRKSGVILRRADDRGGGLHGILTGRKMAMSINHNIANAITYLISVQLFRLVFLAIPALFGTHTLSSVSLLISGSVLDMCAVLLFAFAMPNQGTISCSYSIMRRLEKPITYNVANVISACVGALVAWLGFVLLQIFGVVDATQSIGYGFVSAYLLQGVVFAITIREYATRKRKISPLMLACIVCYVLLFGACIFLPVLNTLTGGATLSISAFALAPLASLIYYVTYRVLTAKGLNLHK